MQPQWIWSPEHAPGEVPQESCYFRKAINLPEVKQGTLQIAADDVYQAYVNGKKIATGNDASTLTAYDITSHLKTGKNVIAVKVDNRNGQSAGLAARISVEPLEGHARLYLTNPTWRTSLRVLPLWDAISYRDSRWKGARNLGPFGSTPPWSNPKKEKGSPAQPSSEQVTTDNDSSAKPSIKASSDDPASDLEAYLAAADADAADSAADDSIPTQPQSSVGTAAASSGHNSSAPDRSSTSNSPASTTEPGDSSTVDLRGSPSKPATTVGESRAFPSP